MAARRPGSTLAALSGALAALPAYAQDDGPVTGYRFSHYSEADLAGSRSASGRSAQRYEVQTHQLSHAQSLFADWQLDADLMFESMSGASPWFVTPDADGQPVQVMSGASIREERAAVSTRWGRELDKNLGLGLNLGLSTEDDYESVSAGISVERENHSGMRTWSAGVGVSDDRLEPTDGGSEAYPDRIVSADKRSWNAFAGVSQVISPVTVAQFSLAWSQDRGFLSDPYKLVFVESQTEPDSRPRERNMGAFIARARHYLRGMATALRADWRHYRDSWGIVSDTVELGAAWRPSPEGWRVHGSLRWYQQSQADFYGPFFESAPANGLYSSDYRLSPYGALSLRLGADYQARHWSAGLAVESYDSDDSYALHSVGVANPGLVDFNIVSLAFSWRFDGLAVQNARQQEFEENVEVVPPEQR